MIGMVLVTILWCTYWVIASGFVRDTFENARARLAERGVALDCKALDWGGFPFRFERDCIEPTLTLSNETVRAGNLLVVMQAYVPNRAVALLDGPLTSASGIAVTHDRAMASARFSGERQWQASLEVPKLKAGSYGTADRLLVSARDTGSDRLDVALDAKAAEILIEAGLLIKLDQASLEASLPRKALGRDNLKALARSGEKIGIDSLRLAKGDLVMTAKGEIGVATSGQIEGHLTTTSNRLDLLLTELRQNFGLSDKDAQTLETMIGLLQPGKTTNVTLDLIAKDGKLYWGPVKLTELPRVM
jgi:hypothetical protein